MKSIIFSLFLLLFAFNAQAQITDVDSSIIKEDSIIRKKPVITPKRVIPAKKKDTVITQTDSIVQTKPSLKPWISEYSVLKQNSYFNFFGKPIVQSYVKRKESKEILFYAMIGMLMYFALIKILFAKYMDNLFALFFRVSLKQKQIREQLIQAPLPSLLLNILFVINGGMYAGFLLSYYNFIPGTGLFWLFLYSSVALSLIYFVKFIVLKFFGWIFNISEATDMYIFIVFLVNKLLAIVLIPFLILFAFGEPSLYDLLVTLSLILVTLGFAYRYIVSYAPIRKQINVTQLHFFIYLCGFEIIPLLVLYKVLLSFLERSI